MTATRIIVLFNLKPGISQDEYEAWARTRDLPSVRALPSIAGFDVFRSTGLLGGGDAPCAYIEIIDVADMAAFGVDVTADPMPAIAAEFGRLADAVFIMTDRL
ncbi:MAG TPA: REDY-like protein HapK [Sphingomonas sp.]|jgi:hypothetical protein